MAFTLFRTVIYASGFIALLLIYVPGKMLSRAGIQYPGSIGAVQIAGLVVGTLGTLFALWCVLAFGTIGEGTPDPFYPPRKLVVTGPYRLLRNPMYAGETIALTGAALYL